MHWLAIYALGLGSAAVAKTAGPAIGRAARPVVRNAIKGGLVLSHEVQRLTEEASAQLGDLTAEAREELAARGAGESTRPAGPGASR